MEVVTSSTVLRWECRGNLRRHRAEDSGRPGWGEALVDHDGLGWRDAVHSDDLAGYEELLQGVAGTDQLRMHDYRVVLSTDGADGPARVVHLREQLTGHAAGDVSVAGITVEITDLVASVELERSRVADMRAFDQFGRRLADTSAPEELVTILAEHSEEWLGTMNVAALLVSDDRRDLMVYQGPHPARGTTSLQVVEFTGDTPAGLAAVTGREAFYDNAEQVIAAFPRLAERIGDDRIRAGAAIPLVSDGEPLGAIWFRWDHAVAFDDHLIELLRRTATAFTSAIVRQNADLENERRLEELMQSNRELQSISAVAAHDLKAPLRRVYSFVQLLEREMDGAPISETASRYADVIRQQIAHMDRLIADLLQYSAANRPTVELGPVDLTDVMNDVEVMLEPLIQAEGATLERGSLPLVRGDRELLAQVFANLVGNAVKYHHPDRAPIVVIEATSSSGDDRHPSWHVTVADNGSGIAEGLHAKIFQMFERGDVEDSEGTGIGLAIVMRIVERHNGTVWVESRPDVGSTFHLTLPGVPSTQTV